MEKWLRLEETINRILKYIFNLLNIIFSKITPKKFKSLSKSAGSKRAKRKNQFSRKLLMWQQRSLKVFAGSQAKVKGMASNTQGHVLSVVLKAKNIKPNNFNPLILFAGLSTLCAPFLLKLKSSLLALKPTTITFGALGMAIFSLASIQIYHNSQQIAKDSGIAKEADLIEELEKAGELSRRPASHGKARQILKVSNVNMPIYLGTSTELSSVLLDFTLITTNRSVRNFLDQNELLVRDRLTNSVHPILPAFTLTTEGKEIIKDKIRNDLNQLVRELDQSGHYQDLIHDEDFAIENVYIDSLLAN